ncbi:unnamed protein product (macronuclear) [Paramecium tetraurelia]|uniref:Ubiquitin-like domain-containing protein n=1 Tax=Paramecium tetraurelia TaxID=5888 RepID=A0C2E3_PARTE|nr:uncharacterized protein GSPATT00034438001 [Paramecium tetraurelia]CAK64960.1 unnamed protein product [Paramecium tetraurelia]|eukprot:XP_001432357.1 hypothetical protein (macronuclear) [Paramecium tetraurelia strain d4-2]
MLKNKELDIDKSILEILAQENQNLEQLQFYYSQQLQINCICENLNFTLQVDYIDKIADYENQFKPKFKKPYKDHLINILCKSGPHKLDTMWFQTGISNNSQVSIQILLPVSFTLKHLIFKEFLPSTWKIHKLIAYIRGKKQINNIIQLKSLNKTIDHDLELYQLYPNIYDVQIEIVEEPQYLIQLSDGIQKKIKINSNQKVSTLCDLIKREFNIIDDLVLHLQYGKMTLNHQALIVDEMILNNSTIVITNQNLNYKTHISDIIITLVNQRNPSQIYVKNFSSIQSINALDQLIHLQDNLFIQYFYKGQQVKENTTIQDLVQGKETEINLEFIVSKKRQIMKNIVTCDGNYLFRFKYLNKEYSQNVSITISLKQIEENLKKNHQIPEDYSIFLNDSFNQSKSIMDLELQSLNIFFEFKNIIPYEILISPIQQTLKMQASTEETVIQLREKIQKTFLKENNEARIQIQLNKNILTDDQNLYKELKASKINQIEVFILNKFQIQFKDENQKILSDDVYEDYCIFDSVISLGLVGGNFFVKNTQIDIKKSFQSYNLNSENQVINYKLLLSGIFNLNIVESGINKPYQFNVKKSSHRQDQSKKQLDNAFYHYQKFHKSLYLLYKIKLQIILTQSNMLLSNEQQFSFHQFAQLDKYKRIIIHLYFFLAYPANKRLYNPIIISTADKQNQNYRELYSLRLSYLIRISIYIRLGQFYLTIINYQQYSYNASSYYTGESQHHKN